MDPLWTLAAQWWWIAPTAVGAGAATAFGVGRYSSRAHGRRLALDAAREDLREAQRQVGDQRRAVKLARAEHARLAAERTASRASSSEVASARRSLKQAEQNAKAASAEVKARRVRLSVAQAEVPPASRPDQHPVTRLHRAHDAVTARWMEYETDPAKAIAYPVMSVGNDPAMAAFLSAARDARDLRPASTSGITPREFAAYRDAVTRMERAFDVAEHTARSRASGRDPDAIASWQEVLSRPAEALDKASAAAASAIAAWAARRKRP